MKLCSEARNQVPKPLLRQQPVLSLWMSLELLEVKLRKIIKMMQFSSAKTTCWESRMPRLLKPRNKYWVRKNLWRNKERLLQLRPRLEKKRCKSWTSKEPTKSNQPISNKTRKTELTHSCQKLKRRWMKKWMMLNTWTKWFCTQKLLQLEINN